MILRKKYLEILIKRNKDNSNCFMQAIVCDVIYSKESTMQNSNAPNGSRQLLEY